MLTNEQILQAVNKEVFGHLQAKKLIINLINRSQTRYRQKHGYQYALHDLIRPSNCTLIGESGSGKTHLVETITRIMDVPFIKVDATSLTHIAARGTSSQTILKDIRGKAFQTREANLTKYFSVEGAIDQMIVMIDEIDKLALQTSDDWNKNTQASFLELFENKSEFNGLTFIFAGAFSGLPSLDRKNTKGSLGFTGAPPIDQVVELDQELIKYGLMPELVGRMGVQVKLDKLEKEHFAMILNDMVLPVKNRELLDLTNKTLELSEEEMSAIVDKAYNSGQGVRYLKTAIEEASIDLEFHNYAPVVNKNKIVYIEEKIHVG